MVRKTQLQRKAKAIKLLAMDVDGVLTNGDVIVLESGEEIKTWNAKDRLGLALVRDRVPNLKIAWITGRKSNSVLKTAHELGVGYVYQHCRRKDEALASILSELNLKPSQAGFIGDDLIDLAAIHMAGFTASPQDAISEVKNTVDYVSPYDGGRGVVRDVLEFVLKAQNKWESLVKNYSA